MLSEPVTEFADNGLDIVQMLEAWGEWQRSRSGTPGASGSLSSAYHEREDRGSGLVINRDPQSEKLDLLICQMGDSMGVFYQRAVVAKYVWQSSMRDIADLHHCSPALAKIRLQTAHAWLNGVVFGIRTRVIT